MLTVLIFLNDFFTIIYLNHHSEVNYTVYCLSHLIEQGISLGNFHFSEQMLCLLYT